MCHVINSLYRGIFAWIVCKKCSHILHDPIDLLVLWEIGGTNISNYRKFIHPGTNSIMAFMLRAKVFI